MKPLFLSLFATVTLFGSTECWNLNKVNDVHFNQMLKNYTQNIDTKSDLQDPLRVQQRQTAVTLDKCDKLRTVQQANSMSSKKILALINLEKHNLNKDERTIKEKALETSIKTFKGFNTSKFFPKANGKLVYFGGEEHLPGKFLITASHLKNGKLKHSIQDITQDHLKKLYCTSSIPLQSYLSSIGLEASCETEKKQTNAVVHTAVIQTQEEVKPINELYMLTEVTNLIKVDDLETKKTVPLHKGKVINIIEKRDNYITFCVVNEECPSARFGMQKSTLNKFQQFKK